MIRQFSPLAFIAAGLAAATPGHTAEYQRVGLPAIASWCAPVTLPPELSDDERAADAARDAAVAGIDRALLAAGVQHSGMPFVTGLDRRASDEQDGRDGPAAAAPPPPDAPAAEPGVLSFDVCVPVPAAAPAPDEPLSARLLPPGDYAVIGCAEAITESCVAELRAAIGTEPGLVAASLEPILATVTAADLSPPAVAAAFAAAADRVTAHGVSVTVIGTPVVLREEDETRRPLRTDPQTARLIAGVPPLGRAAVAIRLPADE